MGENGSYTSQVGIGVWFLALIPSIMQFELNQGISLMLTLVSAVNALVSTVVAVKIRKITGILGIWIFVIISLQPFPSTIMSSIYWFFSLKLLPALVLFIIYKDDKKANIKWWITFVTISFISFGSGYEFITITFFSCVAVWLFFAIKKGQTITELGKLLTLILAQAGAFVASLLLHLFLLYRYWGEWQLSWSALQSIIGKRTGGINGDFADVYLPSLKSSPIEVIGKYLDISVIGSPTSYSLFGSFSVMSLILLSSFLFITNSANKDDTEVWQLNFAALVSLLGSFAWIFLARPHAYIHDFINPAIWYVYSVPILSACVVDMIRRNLKRMHLKREYKIVVISSMTLILLFYVYSSFAKYIS